MIVSRLFCGLGNQMFQYAAGLALAHGRNTVLKLDVSWFSEGNAAVAHERYGLDCFVLDAHFATEPELAWCRGYQRNVAESRFGRLLAKIGLRRYAELLPMGGNWHIQKQFHFYPEFFDLPDGTVIDGTFQSEKFFFPVAKVVRKHFGFRYKPCPEVAALAEQIEGGEAVAVHFRRGDLVASEKYKVSQAALGMNYYREAFAQISSKVRSPRFFIFSDDLDFARNCGVCPQECVFVDCVEDWNASEAIRLMALCKHFIIANSSFSWWGAWLSENEGKIVIRPEPWFSNMPENDTRDLCPWEWFAVARSSGM
jgi:hypothetical protein